MAVRRKHIRTLVDRLLEENNMNAAPVNMKRLAKAAGVIVCEEPADDTLSGFLVRRTGTNRAIICVNGNHHHNRQRFTLAHELGHFFLHEGERVHVDHLGYGFEIRLRDTESSTGENTEEIEANLFAAELLMPTRFLEKDVATLPKRDLLDEQVLRSLARRYQVSVQALTYRLTNLGYIGLHP